MTFSRDLGESAPLRNLRGLATYQRIGSFSDQLNVCHTILVRLTYQLGDVNRAARGVVARINESVEPAP